MLLIPLLFLLIQNQLVFSDDPLSVCADMLLKQLESTRLDAILFWNLVLLQASCNEFDRSMVSGLDQGPPTYTSRAFAIVHGAMYDALNIVHQTSVTVFPLENMMISDEEAEYDIPEEPTTTIAIMEAAYQTLCVLYPKQKNMFLIVRDAYLDKVSATKAKHKGIEIGIRIGRNVASEILKIRQNDGSDKSGSHTPTVKPGYHKADPLHPKQVCLCPNWGNVKPFIIYSSDQFRSPNIVGMGRHRTNFLKSKTFLDNYEEVKMIGAVNSTIRTDDQTEIGNFWAYDSAPKIGVPPRLYNQVARVIAMKMNNTLEENAKLFAAINFALADSCIVCWETKYHYDFWRPIVAIREGAGTIPADPNWTPLGAPSNGNGDNFTPNFPSFVSGHAVFASATFEVLRRFYKTDKISFHFQSDEYNGRTRDSITGQFRPAKTRFYRTLSEAERENYLARIYLGIHWRIDQEYGKLMGRQVAAYVYKQIC